MPEKTHALIDGLREITAHLKERNLLDRSFLHLNDEPAAEEIPGMVGLARLILKEVPEWRGRLADTLNKEATELDSLVTHHIRALKCYGTWYGQGDRAYGGRAEWDTRRATGSSSTREISRSPGRRTGCLSRTSRGRLSRDG